MTLPEGAYRAPAAPAEGELRERKSRFLAFIQPVTTGAEAEAFLEALRRRHPDASHHCWARRLGPPEPEERSSDAGEPAGTAGPPILAALRGAELSDVLAVVVRWFGGIKLGKGGLVRAYGDAVRLALDQTRVVVRFPTDILHLELPYERLGAVKRLIQPPAVELLEERYGEAVCLTLGVHRHLHGELEAALAELGLAAKPESS